MSVPFLVRCFDEGRWANPRTMTMFVWFLIVGLQTAGVDGGEMYKSYAYFWHITDIHYDGHFARQSHSDSRKGCWHYNNHEATRNPSSPKGLLKHYGDYSCDSTWDLIESAAQTMMKTRQNEHVEFVLWTGDALSHHATHSLNEDRQLKIIQNVTDLLRKTFSSQFVFPALGHDDPVAKMALKSMWQTWLPTDALKTFETGGYYIIERKTLQLQVIVLNTNLMKHADEHGQDARQQWQWLEKVLENCKKNGQTVYIVGHIPPGSDERHKRPPASSHIMYRDYHNRRYIRIVRKYNTTIVGQFFGHLHSDSFRIIYDEDNRTPVSWIMLAPSITPKRTHEGWPNNPGLRIYKFEQNSGKIVDYTQYYLDLTATKKSAVAEWKIEYNFSSYYGINEITPWSLHVLAERFGQDTSLDNAVFNKYYYANSVRVHTREAQYCHDTCAHAHYCAITRVDYEEHERCLKVAASALSSSSSYRFSGAKQRLVVPLVAIVSVAVFKTF